MIREKTLEFSSAVLCMHCLRTFSNINHILDIVRLVMLNMNVI